MRSVWALPLLFVLQSAHFPLLNVRLQGHSRFSTEAILAASALRVGQTVDTTNFEGACKKLMETGLFQFCRYSYKPASEAGRSGFDLTLEVAEMAAHQHVRLCIPGIPEGRLWEWLQRHDGLIQSQIPATREASVYYIRAIERFLQEEKRSEPIVSVEEADLVSGRMTVSFQPARLRRVAAIRFQGNQAIAQDALARALNTVAVGIGYTECAFRTLLELNVRPLYEQRGFLKVVFADLSTQIGPGADETTVTVQLQEGNTYNLATVKLVGRDLPEDELLKAARFSQGKLADWSKVRESLAQIERWFHSKGFLKSSTKAERFLNEDSRMVDLVVSIEKGPQFTFGELKVSGLDAESEKRCRRAWKLAPGSPVDETYVDDYLRSLFTSGQVPQVIKGFSKELRVRPRTYIVDVVIGFR